MSFIEKQFYEKTKDKEQYRVLVNYWNCVLIDVPKILSCIAQVFPHYTKHDVSHSYAILDSIERVLGEDAIQELSVTDLWLLLCSAFCHDIGMYISGDDIKKCFEKEEFQKYIIDTQKDLKSSLCEYAKFYEIADGKLKYKKCELSLSSYHSAKFLLADFFRKKHAERSENIINVEGSMMSFFDDIKRLIGIVAKICYLHGANFDEVLQFQNCENGVDDYCHPRFVACMLRLGDLLDFDSSRVSRFMLTHLSFAIPKDSKDHNEKNLCINRALITPKEIEVEAICNTPNVAFEIDKWFSWIKEELFNQKSYWPIITPSSKIKGLPLIGKMETICKNYDKIDNNLRPQFEIGTEDAVEILQGSNFYKEKTQCIRELLQNAIDATYIRIYLENKDFVSKPLKEGFDLFLKHCKNSKYNIKVDAKKSNGIWEIVIQDNGVGMLREELKYLLKIGTGKKNEEKRKIVAAMPEYAKPSGFFGIGFQSIFLITDEVNIKTRSALGVEEINLDIKSPLKGGFAILKTNKNPYASIGTVITFKITANSVRTERSENHQKYSTYYEKIIKNYDFVENTINDIEIANLLDEVCLVGENSYVNIICQGEKTGGVENNVENIYLDKLSEKIVEISPFDERDYFQFGDSKVKVLYKNQLVCKHDISDYLKFLNGWKINLLSGNAGDILTIDRNEFKFGKSYEIAQCIQRVLVLLLLDKWNNLDNNDKINAAMIIEYYGEDKQKKNIKKWWEQKNILGYGLTIKNIVQYESIILRSSQVYGVDEKQNQLIIYQQYGDEIQFLAYVLEHYYNYGMLYKSYKDERNYDLIEIEFKKNSTNIVEWTSWLNFYKRKPIRSLMPCYGYEKITVKEPLYFVGGWDPMRVFEKIDYPRTVCPYIIKDNKLEWDCSDKVFQWVYDNRADSKVTIDEIKTEFYRMKNELNDYVKKVNEVN